jgi:quercetin dioxygenase-like cupin family protein
LTFPAACDACGGVERLRFDPEVAFVPGRGEVLEGVTVAPLTTPFSAGAPFQAAVFRFGAGGRMPRHPATLPQILAVLDGSGEVSGESGVAEPIAAGEAVFWQASEEHEVTTATGMTALIVEGEGLEPFQRPS